MRRSRSTATKQLSDDDFVRLLDFRDSLRRFLHWSEERAHEAGITPAQHQLLLAVRGHGSSPSLSDIAAHLLLRHHSVVELVDRAERAGLLRRGADDADQRVVRLELTVDGSMRLERLAAAHLEELSRLRSSFAALWEHLPEAAP